MAKSPNAFRTISEAADEVGAPQHVLRFWETRFPFLAPVKRAGGRRFYRPQDIVVLKAIKTLLHDQGLTIRGVQKLHKEQGLRRLAAYGDPEETVVFEAEAPTETAVAPAVPSVRLRQVLAELEGARARLDVVLSRTA